MELPGKAIEYLQQYYPNILFPSYKSVLEQIYCAQDYGVQICFYNETNYPYFLQGINTPPPVLWFLGNINLSLDNKIIAIVGTRTPSALGQVLAKNFAYTLNQQKYKICSGMALGIDAIAHQNSLEYGTIAILANGLDIIYPLKNYNLYYQIIKHGLLLSEYSMKFKARPWSFKRRDYIISGTSLATLVVEAKIKSGSLVTANCTLKQNRALFVVAPQIISNNFQGNQYLLDNTSAIAVHTPTELIAHLNSKVSLQSEMPQYSYSDYIYDLDTNHIPYYEQVIKHLDYLQETNIYLLCRKLKLPLDLMETIIVKLELLNLIKQIDSNNIILNSEPQDLHTY